MPKYTIATPSNKGTGARVHVVMKDGKRIDSFLRLVNAKNAIKRYRERDLQNA